MSELLPKNTNDINFAIPSAKSLIKAAEMAIKIEKPLCLDYYVDSRNKQCKIGIDGDDKVLYKNDEEYTSPLASMYKIVDDSTSNFPDYILETHNSIYIVSGAML